MASTARVSTSVNDGVGVHTDPTQRSSRTARWLGLGIALAVMVAAAVVPWVLGWEVHARADSTHTFPPLSATWDVKVGPGTVPAVVIALLACRYAVAWAAILSWPRLLLATYGAGLAWLLSLAYVDGSDGISRVLGNRLEYLQTARATNDVSATLHDFVSRIPLDAPDNWTTHVAGHPPGALLVFVLLDRIGLGGDLEAGLVVTLVAATTSVAVLVALRALGIEAAARRAAPFLVFAPAAIWMAVSADALFAAVAAWGLAALALASTASGRQRMVSWAVLAGVLLGFCCLLSYGLPLLGFLAVAVLLGGGSRHPVLALLVAAGAASGVVLGFAVAGFRLWDAYPVLHERYWDSLARERPAAYWIWGNVAALFFAAGPMLGAGLGQWAASARAALRDQTERPLWLLVGGGLAAVVLADLSLMSKAEVERIWLPFVPWLLLSVALLPSRWRRVGLIVQVGLALALQHLLFTTW